MKIALFIAVLCTGISTRALSAAVEPAGAIMMTAVPIPGRLALVWGGRVITSTTSADRSTFMPVRGLPSANRYTALSWSRTGDLAIFFPERSALFVKSRSSRVAVAVHLPSEDLDDVSRIAWSPDGTTLVIATADRLTLMTRPGNFARLRLPFQAQDPKNSIRWDASGHDISSIYGVSTSTDHDTSTLIEAGIAKLAITATRTVTLVRGGQTFAMAATLRAPSDLLVWDLGTYGADQAGGAALLHVVNGHVHDLGHGYPSADWLTVAPNEKSMAFVVGGFDTEAWYVKTVRFCDLPSGQCRPIADATSSATDPALSSHAVLAIESTITVGKDASPSEQLAWLNSRRLVMLAHGELTRIVSSGGAAEPITTASGDGVVFVRGDGLWLWTRQLRRARRVLPPFPGDRSNDDLRLGYRGERTLSSPIAWSERLDYRQATSP